MVVRAIRALVRGVGWLLTPAIVAATSAGALWLAARLGTGLASADLALATALGASLGAGTAVFAWWVFSLRRARHHARTLVRRREAEAEAAPVVGAHATPPQPATLPSPPSVDEAAD